jgi:hypothetical protein
LKILKILVLKNKTTRDYKRKGKMDNTDMISGMQQENVHLPTGLDVHQHHEEGGVIPNLENLSPISATTMRTMTSEITPTTFYSSASSKRQRKNPARMEAEVHEILLEKQQLLGQIEPEFFAFQARLEEITNAEQTLVLRKAQDIRIQKLEACKSYETKFLSQNDQFPLQQKFQELKNHETVIKKEMQRLQRLLQGEFNVEDCPDQVEYEEDA